MTVLDPITDIRARIGAILEDEFGDEVTVYVNRPKNAPEPDIPAFLITVDTSDYDWTETGNGGVIAVPRIYRIILLAKAWYEGLEFEAEEICVPYIGRVIGAFVNRPSLELPRDDAQTSAQLLVQDSKLVGDSGVINVFLGGVAYAGVEFRLSVLALMPYQRP